MSIQAIETRYQGYRFRSRLEARWAVFFDELNVPWRYEMRGVVLFDPQGEERYLPDFLVGFPGFGHTWFEAKPYIFEDKKGFTDSVERTLRIMTQLCYMSIDGIDNTSYFPGFVVGGDPGPKAVGVLAVPMEHVENGQPVKGTLTCCLSQLAICPCCGKFCFFLFGTKDDARFQVMCGCLNPMTDRVFVKEHRSGEFLAAKVLMDAFSVARSARFEHGETPKVPRGKPRKWQE